MQTFNHGFAGVGSDPADHSALGNDGIKTMLTARLEAGQDSL